MPDILTPIERSERMARVKCKDSKAEMCVRRIVHRLGFRYRLHSTHLPGKPDIVLFRHKKIIQIFGCFWHQHGVCRPLSVPQGNSEFWKKKFTDNVSRDKKNIELLAKLGWKVLVVWECETKNQIAIERILKAFLDISPEGLKATVKKKR